MLDPNKDHKAIAAARNAAKEKEQADRSRREDRRFQLKAKQLRLNQAKELGCLAEEALVGRTDKEVAELMNAKVTHVRKLRKLRKLLELESITQKTTPKLWAKAERAVGSVTKLLEHCSAQQAL